MRAVQITSFGGPEVLTVADVPPPVPASGQVLIQVEAAGVNFADTHQTENSYLAPQTLPLVPGGEVVGRVLGGELDGRRVVALTLGGGGYAEQVLADPRTVFPIPEDLDAGAALALVLQGTTAWHLLRSSAHLTQRDAVVVHAAAGGVGTLAVQLADRWGAARVIGVASSPEKRRLAADLGADALVDLSDTATAEDVAGRLREANDGRPVDVVLEMTGGHVTDGSLQALGAGGRLVLYGMAARTPPADVSPVALMARGLSVAGFWLVHALRLPGGLQPAMDELLSMVRAQTLRPVVGGRYPLEGAAQAHRDLLSRGTQGKLVLELV